MYLLNVLAFSYVYRYNLMSDYSNRRLLRHPNIVQFYGISTSDKGRIGFVMELADQGSTLTVFLLRLTTFTKYDSHSTN